MTGHEERLAGMVFRTIRGLGGREAARQLMREGLIDRTACEGLCIRIEVERLARQGVPRCEALRLTAEKLCCSYEKARTLFYRKKK